jgi:hypothetical protein
MNSFREPKVEAGPALSFSPLAARAYRVESRAGRDATGMERRTA